MAIATKEKTIDEHKIMVTQFNARRGLVLKLQVSKLLIPAIGVLLSGKMQGKTTDDLKKSFMDKDIDLGAALQQLADNVEPEKFLAMAIELMSYTRLDGQEINEKSFDTLFIGEYLLMYKILIFVLEVNYGSFFGTGGIGNLLPKVSPKVSPESQS